jgi:hypothetical protein
LAEESIEDDVKLTAQESRKVLGSNDAHARAVLRPDDSRLTRGRDAFGEKHGDLSQRATQQGRGQDGVGTVVSFASEDEDAGQAAAKMADNFIADATGRLVHQRERLRFTPTQERLFLLSGERGGKNR